MLVTLAWIALAVAQDAPAVSPPPTPVAAPPKIMRPEWTRKPDADDMARNYPPAALKAGIGAKVQFRCQVTATGDLTECEVVAEEPTGWGFGAATLKTVPKYRMRPTASDGSPVDGARVHVTLRWYPD
ncbi:TonB family protein [Caulobacter sp. 17J65-9]|uniref:energy transducer TonB n=1 Tax=Caulobacter sp. 17J65-9 TaxID=2709382 RepID=UPI0013CAA077|nr:TonB family protein [Caulobacter sp. 17J65-9]NEX91348.1 TonB family protein [Caulobacter sp. 17J65-9]